MCIAFMRSILQKVNGAVKSRAGSVEGKDYIMKCQVCGKLAMSGNNVSHSKRRTKTRFLPNVHKLSLAVNGETKKVKICTRCLRSRHKLSRA